MRKISFDSNTWTLLYIMTIDAHSRGPNPADISRSSSSSIGHAQEPYHVGYAKCKKKSKDVSYQSGSTNTKVAKRFTPRSSIPWTETRTRSPMLPNTFSLTTRCGHRGRSKVWHHILSNSQWPALPDSTRSPRSTSRKSPTSGTEQNLKPRFADHVHT